MTTVAENELQLSRAPAVHSRVMTGIRTRTRIKIMHTLECFSLSWALLQFPQMPCICAGPELGRTLSGYNSLAC